MLQQPSRYAKHRRCLFSPALLPPQQSSPFPLMAERFHGRDCRRQGPSKIPEGPCTHGDRDFVRTRTLDGGSLDRHRSRQREGGCLRPARQPFILLLVPPQHFDSPLLPISLKFTHRFCRRAFFWQDGKGDFVDFVRERLGGQNIGSWIRGTDFAGKRGVAISPTGQIKAAGFWVLCMTTTLSCLRQRSPSIFLRY